MKKTHYGVIDSACGVTTRIRTLSIDVSFVSCLRCLAQMTKCGLGCRKKLEALFPNGLDINSIIKVQPHPENISNLENNE